MNIFIIAAPYQILSAIEAVNHFNLTKNILIILYIGSFRKSNFENMIDKKYWDSVRYIDFVYRLTDRDFGRHKPKSFYERFLELCMTFDQLIKRRCIDKLCNSFRFVDNLFLGNYLIDYDLHMRHIANKINFKKLYLLDVGTDTLRISRQRVQENIDIAYQKNGTLTNKEKFTVRSELFRLLIPRLLKGKLRNSFVDWKATGVEELTYFTCYDLEVNGKDCIVKNDYKYSKSLLRNAKNSEDVLFLGQPLVDQEYLSLEIFIDYMMKVKAYFEGKQLFYVPHPRESSKYIEITQNHVGVKIKRFNTPIEYEVAFGGIRPRCIASFFTSAIENCSAIFGDTVDFISFYLPAEHLLKDHNVVEKIYDSFRSNKLRNAINVISL